MVSARTWTFAIILLYTLGGLIVGLAGSSAYESELAFGAIVVVPLYVLTYLWMKADSRERSTPTPPGALPLVVVLLPIAVPYYLVATRRSWRKATALVWLVGFIAIVLALSIFATEAGTWLAT